MTHKEEKRQPAETDLKMSLMLVLAGKDFKTDIETAQGYQEKKLIMKKIQSLEKL